MSEVLYNNDKKTKGNLFNNNYCVCPVGTVEGNNSLIVTPFIEILGLQKWDEDDQLQNYCRETKMKKRRKDEESFIKNQSNQLIIISSEILQSIAIQGVKPLWKIQLSESISGLLVTNSKNPIVAISSESGELQIRKCSEMGLNQIIFSEKFDPINSITLSPNSEHLAVASLGGILRIFFEISSKLVFTFYISLIYI